MKRVASSTTLAFVLVLAMMFRAQAGRVNVIVPPGSISVNDTSTTTYGGTAMFSDANGNVTGFTTFSNANADGNSKSEPTN